MFTTLLSVAYKNTYDDSLNGDSTNDTYDDSSDDESVSDIEGFRRRRGRRRRNPFDFFRKKRERERKKREADARRAREADARRAREAKKARDAARRIKAANARLARQAAAARIAAEKARIAAEKARIERIRVEVCRKVNIEIPKLQALVVNSRKELEDLKSRKKKCMDDYDKGCPSDLSNQLNQKQSLYANLKSSIINLESAYQQEECKEIKSCDNELQASTLAVSNYNTGEAELTNAQSKVKICNDPYRNKCSPILKDLEKSREDINNDIVYMQDKLEGMTIQNNIDDNVDLKNLLADNNLKLNQFKILQNPNTDTTDMFDSEVCKNIVLTTIGSVMLYYLFFEI